jgi:hypothetical protein
MSVSALGERRRKTRSASRRGSSHAEKPQSRTRYPGSSICRDDIPGTVCQIAQKAKSNQSHFWILAPRRATIITLSAHPG